MWVGVITIFPEIFTALTAHGITRRASESKLLELVCWNPRDFTIDKRQNVDDRPYGGGPGMVMLAEPLILAIKAAKAVKPNAKVIYLTPQGKLLKQAQMSEFAFRGEIILLCGRYEGVDERVLELIVDEEWSIGDYVLSGGELAAMVMVDAITRLLPGALGHEDSALEDSFAAGVNLLDCPHYTRPSCYAGLNVPEVLLNGNHQEIAAWRLQQRLGRTWLRRKDLLQIEQLNPTEKRLLEDFIFSQNERGAI